MTFTYQNRTYEDGEAVIQYYDGDMKIIRPGSFVRCAVSGYHIPVSDLKYWSVEKQEAYRSPVEVLKSLGLELGKKPSSVE